MNLIQPFYIAETEYRNYELVTVHDGNMQNKHFTKIIRPSEWPTFAEMFSLCEDGVNVLANADILFDDTIALAEKIKPGEVYALCRWQNGSCWMRRDSQDVWIIRKAWKWPVVPHVGQHKIGLPGSDNRLAWELKQAGYRVLGPSSMIRCWHIHQSNCRKYEQRISPPYSFVEPY